MSSNGVSSTVAAFRTREKISFWCWEKASGFFARRVSCWMRAVGSAAIVIFPLCPLYTYVKGNDVNTEIFISRILESCMFSSPLFVRIIVWDCDKSPVCPDRAIHESVIVCTCCWWAPDDHRDQCQSECLCVGTFVSPCGRK